MLNVGFKGVGMRWSEILEDLGEALFDFSEVADLVTWLNPKKVSN